MITSLIQNGRKKDNNNKKKKQKKKHTTNVIQSAKREITLQDAAYRLGEPSLVDHENGCLAKVAVKES